MGFIFSLRRPLANSLRYLLQAPGTNKLQPQDWKSGNELWVVEVIAPFGAAEELVKDLKAHVFPNQQIKFVAMGKDGKEVRTL
ncbi:MAG: toxin-activating lysine-acyltransferase [Hyphomicrobiaceae bacterium]